MEVEGEESTGSSRVTQKQSSRYYNTKELSISQFIQSHCIIIYLILSIINGAENHVLLSKLQFNVSMNLTVD